MPKTMDMATTRPDLHGAKLCDRGDGRMVRAKMIPRRCCGLDPDIFTDTKVGRTEQVWIVTCANCGKYSTDAVKKVAIEKWDNKDYL